MALESFPGAMDPKDSVGLMPYALNRLVVAFRTWLESVPSKDSAHGSHSRDFGVVITIFRLEVYAWMGFISTMTNFNL